MLKRKVMAMAVAGAVASLASTGASAIEFTAGNWKMNITGSVNAFYTHNSCDKTGTQAPAIVAFLGPCNPGAVLPQNPEDSASIQNGLLPGYIQFAATTQAKGLDLKAQLGFWPGTSNTNAGQAMGDMRQVFLEFGSKNWGSIKLGRDIGLFQQNAILNDMTLLSIGAGAGFQGAVNTTLGMIGTGYIYTEFQPQITYTTPNWNGFNAALGVFQPRNTLGIGFTGVNAASFVGDEFDTPGWQGLAQFEWKGQASGKVWGSFVTQEATIGSLTLTGLLPGTKIDGEGYELGGKVGFSGFEAMLVGFWGDGLGESFQFTNSHDITGQARDSEGFLAQLTWKIPNTDLQLGVSYGENELDATTTDVLLGIPLMDKNKAYVFQVKYDLMPGLSLIAEYINNEQTAHTPLCSNILGTATVSCENEADTIALGAIVFF
jgi:predicted porin